MNTTRVTNGVASPAAARTCGAAESSTSSEQHDPRRDEPQDHWVTTTSTCVSFADRRRLGGRSRGEPAVRLRATGGACRRAGPACAARVGLVGRRGGIDPQRPRASCPRKRSRASSRLRACERESDAVARTTGPRRSSSRARWRGPSDADVVDAEPHLDARVGLVRVLPARDPPSRVVRHSSSSSADHAARRDPQTPLVHTVTVQNPPDGGYAYRRVTIRDALGGPDG